MTTPQIIYNECGKPLFALIPYSEYLIYKTYTKSIEEETFPLSITDRIMEGTHPIKVFREYRGMGQGELADKAGASLSTINKIECGHIKPSAKLQAKITNALNLSDPEILDEPVE